MKKFLLPIVFAGILMMTLCFCGCSDSAVKAVAPTGTYIGQDNDGVDEFLGIRYGNMEPFKAATDVTTTSEDEIEATSFGANCIQPYDEVEAASQDPCSQDCLFLNVWTKDVKTEDKPVIMFIHGGSCIWGGTTDPSYDGEYFIRNLPEEEDCVLVTINYRMSIMSGVDMSVLEGYTDEYADAINLSKKDQTQALKWIQENISAFGGDPDNVTIFGESAGGAFVSILCAVDEADGLFAKAIAQSGSLNLTYTKEDFDDWGLTQALMDKTGAKNMDDLMAIPEDELIEIYTAPDEEGNCLNDLYNMPLRGEGSIIPEDPYQALKDGAAKDVIMMIGTNSDEWRYWVNEMGDVEMSEMDDDGIAENMAMYEEYVAQEKYDSAMAAATSGEKSKLKKFLDIVDADETVWKYTEIGNETGFRMPSIAVAEAQNEGGGTAYMYYFCKKSDNFDFIGACHASELAYVFHNTDETIFSGTVDKKLADDMCTSWTNFARTGDPGNDNAVWDKYTLPDRATMVIGDDCSMKMVNDPKGEQRELMEWSVKYYLK